MKRHDLPALKRSLPLVSLLEQHGIELRQNGTELVALCPFHSEKTPSFTVEPDKGDGGLFYCMGCGAGGDQLSFVQQHYRLPPGEAINKLAEMAGGDFTVANDNRPAPRQIERAPAKADPWRYAPARDGEPAPTELRVNRGGQWGGVRVADAWPYYSADAELLAYDCRIEEVREDGSIAKQVIPVSWMLNTETGEERWRMKSLPEPRSLFGAEQLAAHPQHQVLIVEGCKTAAAARRLLAGRPIVVVSWMGGGKAVSKSDWSQLEGRKAVIWPDCDSKTDQRTGDTLHYIDQPGMAAALEIAGHAERHGAQVRIVQVPAPHQLVDGYDLADAEAEGWDAVRVMQFLRDNLRTAAEILAAYPAVIPANDNMPDDYGPPPDYDDMPPIDHDQCPASWSGVDIYSPLPDVNSNGKPLSTIENLQEICRRLGVVVRYNVISKEEEILVPGHRFSIDNAANASNAIILSWCARFRMPVGQIGDFITMIADQNQHNPVATWVKSKQWDGVDRLDALYATITAEGEATDPARRNMKETLIRRWLISAIAAAFNPHGVSAHGVLVLQGDQYLGKTKWFKSLVPEELGVLQDGMTLRPDDRDSVKQVCSFWLVELGELDATFRKSDIAALKAFLTKKTDVLRKAYARKESTFARRTVFFGSVNPKQFLHDPTGNRRYWTIECTKIDHSHDIDMQQLWAQVLTLYQGGESYYLEPGEMDSLNESNVDFQVADPVEERIAERLQWEDKPAFWKFKTVTEVLISVGVDRPTIADCTKAGIVIRRMNGGRGKRTGTARLVMVPDPKM